MTKGLGGQKHIRGHNYYVYILASHARVLYVGVTRDLVQRVHGHRERRLPAFTARYRVARLVYFEHTTDIQGATAREKEIKGWRRARKLALVDSANPAWNDLLPNPEDTAP